MKEKAAWRNQVPVGGTISVRVNKEKDRDAYRCDMRTEVVPRDHRISPTAGGDTRDSMRWWAWLSEGN